MHDIKLLKDEAVTQVELKLKAYKQCGAAV